MASHDTPRMNFGRGHADPFAEKVVLTNGRGTLKRLLRYLGAYWKAVTAAFACVVVSTLVSILGTRLCGYVIDAYILEANLKMLGYVCILMLGMYLAGTGTTYLQNRLMIRVAQTVSAKIREDLFRKVQRLPLRFFDSHSSGDVMSRLTNDIDNIATAISQNAVQLLTSIVSVAGMLIAMLILSPLLTLVTLVTSGMTFLVSRAIAGHARRFFAGQQKNLGEMNGYIEEMVSGQKVLRLFSREEEVKAGFAAINDRYVADATKAQSAANTIGPINNMVNNAAYLLVAVCGSLCVITGIGGISVGDVFSFMLYMRNFTNPINNILTLINTLQLALASAERVFETMDEEPEQDEPDAQEICDIEGRIRLEHVDFSYIPGKQVLYDASISAVPGETVAIVGPTGAGKTTIISLLTRFYEIDSGTITVDSLPIQKITRNSLRRQVALVLQDTFLFSSTIRENIRYGRLDATDAEVEQAARQAHAHEFIMQLPQGYDTILADNGENLSQGQRQLLNIARAIISDASILILDEATSSVDTRTEQIIQAALLELMKDKTSFVIAHRLSTIRNADKILVVNGGRIIEQGDHEALLKKKGFYYDLYMSQFRPGTVSAET
ncbi:MAG: ABC transporter ATP-binding protein [Oscillospiraceae bacterium]